MGVADEMLELAERFVAANASETVLRLDYSPADAAVLDDLAGSFAGLAPTPEQVTIMAYTMGAYLGELIVRSGGGEWIMDDGQPGVRLKESGLVGHPLEKVAQRIQLGPAHDLGQFFRFAMSGTAPTDPQ